MAKIVLAAHDAGPSNALGAFAKVLDSPAVFLANAGKTYLNEKATDAMRYSIRTADFVLIGMSFPEANAAIELMAAKTAAEARIPYGFCADIPGAWNRVWFAPYRASASLLLTVGGVEEIAKATALFPKAYITRTGNPEWEKYFLPASRSAARGAMGASDDEFVILSPGGKDAVLNIQSWSTVVEAASLYRSNVAVVLTCHPGDRTPKDVYQSLAHYGQKLGVRVLCSETPSDVLVPGVDVVVQTPNFSVGLHAMCRRVPVIDMMGAMAAERVFENTGTREGQFAGTEAVLSLYYEEATAPALAQALVSVRTNTVMREAQERLLPPLKQGGAVAAMKAAVEEVLNKKR